ncbi:MAG: hypothetical protein ACXABY_36680 [Candidatus Thorarchaeota archaeon]
MFVVTIIFLAGLISAVQISLFIYSSMDVSETIARNDLFLYNNLREVINKTVISSVSCTDATANLNELKSFLNNREIQSFEYVINLDFMVECGNWNNYYPADPPILMSINIVSGPGSLQMITKDNLKIYRYGILKHLRDTRSG